MTPPLTDLLFTVLVFVSGALLAYLWTRPKVSNAIILGTIAGTIVLASALYGRYANAATETCEITGSWVRFYDTPEMCSAEIVDRLTVDSDAQPEATVPVVPESMEITTDPAEATTEDGFQGDLS